MKRYDFDEHGAWIAHDYGDYCSYEDHLLSQSQAVAEATGKYVEIRLALHDANCVLTINDQSAEGDKDRKRCMERIRKALAALQPGGDA